MAKTTANSLAAKQEQKREKVTQLEKQLHNLKLEKQALNPQKTIEKTQKKEMKAKILRNAAKIMTDGGGNLSGIKHKLISAGQMICNPHDNLHITMPMLLPVNGDVPTTSYCDVDNLKVVYPANPSVSSASGLTGDMAVGILYSDYVRNTITFSTPPDTSNPVPGNPPNKSFYQFMGTDQLASIRGVDPTPNFVRRTVGASGYYNDVIIDYLRASPDTQYGYQPHGSILGVGISKGKSFFYMNKGDYVLLQIKNASSSGITASNMILSRYDPQGSSIVDLASAGTIAGSGGTSAANIRVQQDGYYSVAFSFTGGSAGGLTELTYSGGVFNHVPLGASDCTAYCWAHLPAPGFTTIAQSVESARVNGTVLEYHNVGSVTNGLVYAGVFQGTEWYEQITLGFAAFQQQTRDNEIAQSNPENLGALVRLPLDITRLDALRVQHRHVFGKGFTFLSFDLDNPGPFAMLWSVIAPGTLGAPQLGVWKRGVFLQFETNDTTRPTGISTMSRKEYNAVRTLVSDVPYWGHNETHWTEVGNFLRDSINIAEKVAPAVSGFLSLF